jgi:hypothetical protein
MMQPQQQHNILTWLRGARDRLVSISRSSLYANYSSFARALTEVSVCRLYIAPIRCVCLRRKLSSAAAPTPAAAAAAHTHFLNVKFSIEHNRKTERTNEVVEPNQYMHRLYALDCRFKSGALETQVIYCTNDVMQTGACIVETSSPAF